MRHSLHLLRKTRRSAIEQSCKVYLQSCQQELSCSSFAFIKAWPPQWSGWLRIFFWPRLNWVVPFLSDLDTAAGLPTLNALSGHTDSNPFLPFYVVHTSSAFFSIFPFALGVGFYLRSTLVVSWSCSNLVNGLKSYVEFEPSQSVGTFVNKVIKFIPAFRGIFFLYICWLSDGRNSTKWTLSRIGSFICSDFLFGIGALYIVSLLWFRWLRVFLQRRISIHLLRRDP